MIKRHPNIDLLKQQFPIPNFNESNINDWDQLHRLSIRAIANAGGVLPNLPPLERHPYLVNLDPQSEVTGLMIGTFPPITYLCSQYNLVNLTYNKQKFTAPDIDYFHGNYSSLWKYAPIGFNQIRLSNRSQQPLLIKNAIGAAGINYTDIIKYNQRVLKDNKYNASDKNLNSIIPNTQIFDYLKESIVDRLYFTNASFFHKSNNLFNPQGFLNLKENDAFGLFIKTALDLNIKVEYRLEGKVNWIEINELPKPTKVRKDINSDLRSKVLLNLRLTFPSAKPKNYKICSSVSPAALRRGRVKKNPSVQLFSITNNTPIENTPERLLIETLERFFNNQLGPLARYNA